MSLLNRNIGLDKQKVFLYTLLPFCLFGIAYAVVHMGMVGGMVACIPLFLIGFFYMINNPNKTFLLAFILNYYLMGATRYIYLPSIGMAMDGLLFFIFLCLFIKSCYQKVEWKNAKNSLTVAAFLWFLYCFLQLFNPLAESNQAWLVNVRGMATYFLMVVILVPILFNRIKDLKTIMIIWGVLTLTAVLKAHIQRSVGFDAAENSWLAQGGYRTHIISTGTRYFSFFTDAANFGAGMGLSMVVFIIASLYSKSKTLKTYFLIVGLLAAFGMIISGTRSAMVVPITGFAFFLFLSKKIKIIVGVTVVFCICIFVLGFTTIGHGNREMRRMRSLFNPEDASRKVREENQKLIGEYMAGKPFGVGLGMGGGKGLQYVPDSYISTIPTDSHFVVIWVETGIVGVVFYLGIMGYCILAGMYICLFKIKNDELRGWLSGILSGVVGMLIASSSNETFAQFPNGIIIYALLAFVFIGPKLDKELDNE